MVQIKEKGVFGAKPRRKKAFWAGSNPRHKKSFLGGFLL